MHSFNQSVITMLLPAIFVFMLIAGGGASGGDTFDHIFAFVVVLLTMAVLHYTITDVEP